MTSSIANIPNLGKAELTSSASNGVKATTGVKDTLYAFLANNTDPKTITELNELAQNPTAKAELKTELTTIAKTEQGTKVVRTLASAGNSAAQEVLSSGIGSAVGDKSKNPGRVSEASQQGVGPSTIAVA